MARADNKGCQERDSDQAHTDQSEIQPKLKPTVMAVPRVPTKMLHDAFRRRPDPERAVPVPEPESILDHCPYHIPDTDPSGQRHVTPDQLKQLAPIMQRQHRHQNSGCDPEAKKHRGLDLDTTRKDKKGE